MAATKEDIVNIAQGETYRVKTINEIVLVPQPSDDPKDPLNWSNKKKILTLCIVSFVSCISLAQALANQAGFFPQAALYHKTPVQLSYSVGFAAIYITPP